MNNVKWKIENKQNNKTCQNSDMNYILQIAPGLPKTRSGKIMRRILRKVAANQHDELGDISTLADPSVVEEIINNHNIIMAQHEEKRAEEDANRAAVKAQATQD